MQKIVLKIHQYIEEEHTLIVSFASDKTKHQDPEAYEKFAYNPFYTWPDVNDMTQIPLLLGRAGMYHTEQQVRKEELVVNETQVNVLKNLAGKVIEFSAEDLKPKY
jgi:hypothetical protein